MCGQGDTARSLLSFELRGMALSTHAPLHWKLLHLCASRPPPCTPGVVQSLWECEARASVSPGCT